MKKFVAVLLAVIVMLICQAAVAVDATSAWNQYCLQYRFYSYPQSSGTTFQQAYYGQNFSSDFAAIRGAVDGTLSMTGDGTSSDDLLNATLNNWN